MPAARLGFRAVLRQPALIFAEIAWRWAFGAAAWALALLSIRNFLANISVSEAETQLARTWQPFLMADVVARVLAANWDAALRATLVLTLGIAFLWVLAATVGRSATLKAMLGGNLRVGRSAMFNIHILRALVFLAGLIAWVGGLIVIGAFGPDPERHAGAMFLAGFGVLFLVALCWSVANWFLALAPIFVVRDGQHAMEAVSASFALYQRRTGEYVAVASWFGLLRVLGLVLALLISLVPVAMVGRATPVAITLVTLLIALAYFAFADFLYIARLAAFVELAGNHQAQLGAAQQLAPSTAG